MKNLLKYIVDRIVGEEESKEEQKYIVDFGNEEYGVICTVGNRKDMYVAKSNPPGLVRPNKYTFDEISESDLQDYSTLRPVPNE